MDASDIVERTTFPCPIADLLLDDKAALQVVQGLAVLASNHVDASDTVENAPLCVSIAHPASSDRQATLVMLKRLVVLASGRVNVADVVESSTLPTRGTNLLEDGQTTLVVYECFAMPPNQFAVAYPTGEIPEGWKLTEVPLGSGASTKTLLTPELAIAVIAHRFGYQVRVGAQIYITATWQEGARGRLYVLGFVKGAEQ